MMKLAQACMFRGVTEKDIQQYLKNGQFPSSMIPVFCDSEVMEYEGMSSNRCSAAYNQTDWLNVTQDSENALGYGNILIWVDASHCELTPSKQYGVVCVKDINPSTKNKVWDFVEPTAVTTKL